MARDSAGPQVSPYCCPTPPQTPESCRAGPKLDHDGACMRMPLQGGVVRDGYKRALFPKVLGGNLVDYYGANHLGI